MGERSESGGASVESVASLRSVSHSWSAWLLALVTLFAALLLAGCGEPADPFAGTYSYVGSYDAVMVIAPAPSAVASAVAAAASGPSAPSAAQVYRATWYLGKQKPGSFILVARGDSLYAAKDKAALREMRFDAEMFREDEAGLWGWSGELLGTNWHRYSEATKNPPW